MNHVSSAGVARQSVSVMSTLTVSESLISSSKRYKTMMLTMPNAHYVVTNNECRGPLFALRENN